MKSRFALLVVLLGAVAFVGAGPRCRRRRRRRRSARPPPSYPAATTPVAFWSTEARCAIVPAGPGGIFGSENFGNKFPGEAAVYMGIVHVAIYDAAVAIEGGYRPYVPTPAAPANTSPEAAIATAAYDTLTGLQPQLGADQTILDDDYAAYLAAIPDGRVEVGQALGSRSASRSRRRCSRCARTTAGSATPRSRTSARPRPAPASGNPRPGRCSAFACPGCRPLALDKRLAVPARRPESP